MSRFFWWSGALLLLSCSPLRDNEALLSAFGEACTGDIHCASPLVCAHDGTCAGAQASGTTAVGDACAQDQECRFSLSCNSAKVCAVGGSAGGALGDSCEGQGDCLNDLVCAGDKRCAAPGGEGTAEEGDDCVKTADCLGGLICAEEVCAPAPSWDGVICPSPPNGPPRVLFQLPRGGDEPFFSLPFPNDARSIDGVLDLHGFPGLGEGEAPGEIINLYTGAVREEIRGFSPNSAVIFRFSEQVNFDSLTFGGDQPTFGFVDVTPDHPAQGRRPRSRFFATTDRGRYICHNWLGIRPSEGSPLEEGHTYAVYFREGIKAESGGALEPDEDFAAMMQDITPLDPALAGVWRRYAPFRDWLTVEGIPLNDVIGATVFTVGAPTTKVMAMHAAVREAASPVLEEEILCDGGTPSPCEGGDSTRACGEVNGLYNEIHVRLRVPEYLTGEPPYESGGGRITFKDGVPQEQRMASLCVAITVPRTEPPEEGWPIVLFNHDTGGHYRSFVEDGVAARMARLDWATISFDRPLHGARYGLSLPENAAAVAAVAEDPSKPGRLHDTALQEVADLAALTRAASSLRIQTDRGRQGFNPERFAFFGHGRGAENGLLFLAFNGAMKAGVLAGAGGGVVDQIQHGTAPLDLARMSITALAETELNGMHPGLHLMQTFLDARDPMNYGHLLRTPPEGVPGKHIFMIDGVGDEIVPKGARNALAVSMRLQMLGVAEEEFQSVSQFEGAVAQGNVRIRGADRTQIVKQYAPDEGGGHHVIFTTVETVGDLNQFFTDLKEGLPSIAQ